jgi:hypothetical protein
MLSTLKEKFKMTLLKGKAAKTKAGIQANIETEISSGKPIKQAIAITYSEAGEKKKKGGSLMETLRAKKKR